MTQSEESITRMTSYGFPHHDNRSFASALDDVLTFLYKDHGAGRQKELLAHVVRLRILACRNDLNRKRIVSLQLTTYHLIHIKIRYPSHLTDTVFSVSYTISLSLLSGLRFR